jgi:predicted nucleic acid-binding Zn ribbon protein
MNNKKDDWVEEFLKEEQRRTEQFAQNCIGIGGLSIIFWVLLILTIINLMK